MSQVRILSPRPFSFFGLSSTGASCRFAPRSGGGELPRPHNLATGAQKKTAFPKEDRPFFVRSMPRRAVTYLASSAGAAAASAGAAAASAGAAARSEGRRGGKEGGGTGRAGGAP